MKHIKGGKQVVALLAPSIVGQLPGNIYQLKTALLKGGFTDVFEVAEGADITTKMKQKNLKSAWKKAMNL